MLVRGFEVEGLVRALGVVGVEPGTQGEARVLDGFEVPSPDELLLEGLDEALADTGSAEGYWEWCIPAPVPSR